MLTLMWVISTPKISKITLSNSTKSDLSYETELEEYKTCVDEIIRLEKSLKKKLVTLSNSEIEKVAKGTLAEAIQILGAKYSPTVLETCKEIVQLEDRCELIFMSLGASITE